MTRGERITNIVEITHYYGVAKASKELVYLGTDSPGMHTGQAALHIQNNFSVVYSFPHKLPEGGFVCWKPSLPQPPVPPAVHTNNIAGGLLPGSMVEVPR